MKLIRILYLFITFCLTMTSCGDKEDKEDELDDGWTKTNLCQQLIGTSWQFYSEIDYWSDGSEKRRDDGLGLWIITFTDKPTNNKCYNFQAYIIEAYNTDTKEIDIYDWWLYGMEIHTFLNDKGPSLVGDIHSLTSDCLQFISHYIDGRYQIRYYQRVY